MVILLISLAVLITVALMLALDQLRSAHRGQLRARARNEQATRRAERRIHDVASQAFSDLLKAARERGES